MRHRPGAYVGPGVRVGDRCKIQNHALVYEPAVLEDGVFIGPGGGVHQRLFPRAVTPDGALKTAEDWEAVAVVVREGASIGARAVCVAPVTIGRWAMVAAGAVVAADVPDFALVAGVPARRIGWVGRAGVPLEDRGEGVFVCPAHRRRRTRRSEGRLSEGPSAGSGRPLRTGALVPEPGREVAGRRPRAGTAASRRPRTPMKTGIRTDMPGCATAILRSVASEVTELSLRGAERRGLGVAGGHPHPATDQVADGLAADAPPRPRPRRCGARRRERLRDREVVAHHPRQRLDPTLPLGVEGVDTAAEQPVAHLRELLPHVVVPADQAEPTGRGPRRLGRHRLHAVLGQGPTSGRRPSGR